VVIDRQGRVLHISHRVTGLTLCPGGHIEAGDRTLLAAAVREACEETGLRPGDLSLTPQFLDEPIDVDVHDIDANPAKGEAAHQHFDIRFAFYLTAEQPPALALQDEEVAGAQWLPYADVRSPTLRAKLLAAEQHGLDGRPEPVSANALIHDFTDRSTSPRVTRSDPLLHCPVRINQPPQLSSGHRKRQRGDTSGA
jgi:8-oxo-dGTP pyrophosphatase MutT (NUDIX family)